MARKSDRSRKTHFTAVVLIPPADVWPPIQEIRARHDRQFRRWMPHITMLYPFRPRDDFDEVADALRGMCRAQPPFSVQLTEFRVFSHGRGRHTLWLAPEPADSIVSLHRRLLKMFPDCDDTARHAHGFTPHLSVGQAMGAATADALCTRLSAAWKPISFTVAELQLIWRSAPPDDVFRVAESIALDAEA